MTVRINKQSINLREKLSELDKPSGLAGEELLRSGTSSEARDALDLEEHLFEEFESTGIDDNATSTKVTVSDSGVVVDGTVTADSLTVDGSALLSGYNLTHTFKTKEVSPTSETNLLFNNRDGNSNYYDVASIVGKSSGNGGSGELLFNTQFSGTGLRTRMGIERNGDVHFFEDTGTTAKMVWDASAESLGIGTSSPSTYSGKLSVRGNIAVADGSKTYHWNSGNTSTVWTANIGGGLAFGTGSTTERMRIDSSGNVGIGTSSPSDKLHVAGTDAVLRLETTSTTGQAGVQFWDAQSGTNKQAEIRYNDSSNLFTIQGNANGTVFLTPSNTFPNSEAMRLDSSGNLLVGKTSTPLSVAGTSLFADGTAYHTVSENATIRLNRLSTDGIIADFRKDGSPVGSIGVTNSLGVRSTHYSSELGTGITFGNNAVFPCDKSGSIVNSSKDLGGSNRRFKDLYLSGGVYLGGTGAANKLDDYEEGTWTPDFRFSGGSTGVTGTQVGKFTKIGNKVTVYFEIRLTSKGTSTGSARVYGLPFVAASAPIDWVGSPCVNFANLSGLNSLPTAFVYSGYSYLNWSQLNSAGTGNIALSNSNVENNLLLGAAVTYFTNS